MIKNNTTLDGINVEDCKFNSKKKVIRICDCCQNEKIVAVNTIFVCRKRHNTNNDYCLSCACKIYNGGNNNPAKKKSVREKISKNTLGMSKTFKDGKNPRILPYKKTVNGYLLKWSNKHNKHVLEHQLIMSEELNKNIEDLMTIHHIDGNKLNNDLSNLIELSNRDHSLLHKQLESVGFELFNLNIIYFDKNEMQYKINSEIINKTLQPSYGLDSVALKQKKNILQSRLDADIKSEIVRGVFVEIPMIAANMSTVINAKFYKLLHKLGAFAILHRAQSNDAIYEDVKDVAKDCEWVAASIGAEKNQINHIKNLIKFGCNIITIDIAHGYSDYVLELAKKIKLKFPHVKLIVGNTTNVDMLYECYDYVDAIKVGIAQGFACETKNTAGCTEKQFSAILKFKEASSKFGVPIISDGSIREPADLVKSIAAGANSIMAGKVFAACPESAAETYISHDSSGEVLSKQKIYAGMASRYVQEQWRGGLKKGTCPEGGIKYLDIGETAEKLLERYSGALKSGITYCGAKDIKSLQKNAEFILLK